MVPCLCVLNVILGGSLGGSDVVVAAEHRATFFGV